MKYGQTITWQRRGSKISVYVGGCDTPEEAMQEALRSAAMHGYGPGRMLKGKSTWPSASDTKNYGVSMEDAFSLVNKGEFKASIRGCDSAEEAHEKLVKLIMKKLIQRIRNTPLRCRMHRADRARGQALPDGWDTEFLIELDELNQPGWDSVCIEMWGDLTPPDDSN